MSELTTAARALGFGSTLDAIEAAEKAIAGVPANPETLGAAIASVAAANTAVQMAYAALSPLFSGLESLLKPAPAPQG